jgi:hypothetical protein
LRRSRDDKAKALLRRAAWYLVVALLMYTDLKMVARFYQFRFLNFLTLKAKLLFPPHSCIAFE